MEYVAVVILIGVVLLIIADKLSGVERSEIACKAALARWGRRKEQQKPVPPQKSGLRGGRAMK